MVQFECNAFSSRHFSRVGPQAVLYYPLDVHASTLPVRRNREPDTEHKEVTQEKRNAVKLKPEHGLQNEHMCATKQACERSRLRACHLYCTDYCL